MQSEVLCLNRNRSRYLLAGCTCMRESEHLLAWYTMGAPERAVTELLHQHRNHGLSRRLSGRVLHDASGPALRNTAAVSSGIYNMHPHAEP